jgi:hypothetical protein
MAQAHDSAGGSWPGEQGGPPAAPASWEPPVPSVPPASPAPWPGASSAPGWAPWPPPEGVPAAAEQESAWRAGNGPAGQWDVVVPGGGW